MLWRIIGLRAPAHEEVAMQRHTSRGWSMAIALGLAAAAPAAAQIVVDPALGVATWAAGLATPVSFAFLPDSCTSATIALVCEKNTGRLRVVRDGVLDVDPALDLPVNFRSERGLLGIAVHPDFCTNHHVYLYYTESSTGTDVSTQTDVVANRVVRGTWSGTTLDSLQNVLTLPVLAGPNHDGGVILFGPDAKLYGVIGDLNHAGQLQNYPLGPPPDDTGIIFRIDDDGTAPADNPFFGLGGAMAKVYAYGVRNSFGLGFDPVSGDLWQSENGPASYDELNRVTPGFNSGWDKLMGPDGRDPQGPGDLWEAVGAQYSDPEFSWLATVAPTAVLFQPDATLGEQYTHDLFVADNNFGNVYRFEVDAGRTGLVMPDPGVTDLVADNAAERNLFRWASGFGAATDLETGPDGALYVCSVTAGALYRIARHPTSDALGPAWRVVATPNPFRTGTRLQVLGPPAAARADLRIYSPAGTLVRALPGGAAARAWDGRDALGRPVAAGVYWVVAEGGGDRPLTKLVRLR
jgi:glucose/arabinose dehydrogenase